MFRPTRKTGSLLTTNDITTLQLFGNDYDLRFLARILTRVPVGEENINTVDATTRPEEKSLEITKKSKYKLNIHLNKPSVSPSTI